MFLPLLDPADVETLELAAAARDFAIRESAAEMMASHPLPEHLRSRRGWRSIDTSRFGRLRDGPSWR